MITGSGTGSGNSSPVILPVDGKAANFHLPQIPNVNNESPNSSAPSTPNDDQAHKQAVTLGGEDYFMSALKFRGGDSASVPGTPSGTIKRNATFSPRIQFHDTWPSQEYDRRGEIATCNRLTPMLAQQIKEELNTFKMVRYLVFTLLDYILTEFRKWRFMRILRSTHISSNETTIILFV